MMVPTSGNGSCVWNPKTNRSLLEEFAEWLEADLKAANAVGKREETPWIVSYAHKAWYMQPGCNFSFIDDLAHKYGIDLHIGGTVLFPLYQPNLSLATMQSMCMRGTVRVFRQEFTLADAIGSHTCSLEALAGV
jgi:hypothetical protein